jgi:hypothetical protein
LDHLAIGLALFGDRHAFKRHEDQGQDGCAAMLPGDRQRSCCRPAAVPLSAFGSASPIPRATNHAGLTPEAALVEG